MPETENDVIGIVPPDTGADEMLLVDESNPDVTLPVAMYVATTPSGQESGAMLFRFKPTMAQRGKIALGEDLFLIMVLPNRRPPLPIELQVGPGAFQLKSAIVGVDGESLAVEGEVRSQLWTPETSAPT